MNGEVSEAQMKALFGEGMHPDADTLVAERVAAGDTPTDAIAAARLGSPYYRLNTPEAPVSAELAALRSFQSQRPDDAAIVLRLGRRLAFFNQYAEATEVCEQGLASLAVDVPQIP